MAAMAKQSDQSIEDVAKSRLKAIPAGRFGEPKEFGQLCAYICSAQASYITGHNFLIDGGVYNGTL
jgi:3-oxoacyl-[acyl-carrier protein] reductase